LLTYSDLTNLFLFILPPYLANSAPILMSGGPALDMGKRLTDGERLLGENKTLLGLCSALLVGLLVSLMEGVAVSERFIQVGVASSSGAVLGDLAGAFIKRRLRTAPGKPFFPLDQLDFLIGAVLLSAPFFQFTVPMLVVVFALTPPIHLLTNRGAYLLGLKGTWW